MRKKGFTLLELILALTTLSFILLASSSLSTSAARFGTHSTAEIYLQNELQYVLRDMEVTLSNGKDPEVTLPAPSCSPNCVHTLKVTDDSDIDIYYSYDAASQTFSKKIGSNTAEILSTGILIQKGTEPIFAIPSISDDLVEINLGAQMVGTGGKTITVPGITKSILLREGIS